MDTTEGTASGTSASDTSSTITQLRRELATSLSTADTSAAQTVQSLKLVQQARLSGLSRTAAALKAQYGPDDIRVQQAEAAVAATTEAVGRVSMVSQQLTTPVLQVSQNGWALHGRVFTAELQPVAEYTVFLVDAQKAYQQSYGFAYTDDTGYFLLNYEGTEKQAAPSQQLFLEIADTKSQPVYLSATAFQPVAGSITYQNVVLPAGGQPIGNPPKSIRKVAIPGKKG